ncbi:MAG: hypothetical protein KJI72_04135 [Patescibacteria group bacterium]|nr:hypothetical protein [Patescibacteria group bacterium]
MNCKKCGAETYHRHLCHACLDKWQETRLKAFQQAESELGKLCAGNHKELTRRVKELEKESP